FHYKLVLILHIVFYNNIIHQNSINRFGKTRLKQILYKRRDTWFGRFLKLLSIGSHTLRSISFSQDLNVSAGLQARYLGVTTGIYSHVAFSLELGHNIIFDAEKSLLFSWGDIQIQISSDILRFHSDRQKYFIIFSKKYEKISLILISIDTTHVQACRCCCTYIGPMYQRSVIRYQICYYDSCAEKWTHGHKCSSTAQFHAMEEVWGLF
ncbi:hypothetical protein ACJX0J_007223, partial [Zea mays]